ncbi:MAG: DUF4236 domain-containing protein [Hyphomicrobiaceae bacterium]|nr:DUF4236 domain-containing protein [Hyphomicrobiaceae bacterium]
MGLRFQKRIKILPGVYINLSKSGVSASVGGHGATVNVGHTGKRMVTLGIPGTGLSYRVPLSSGILMLLVGVAVLIGVAYLVAPDAVHGALHWWQPKWFPK